MALKEVVASLVTSKYPPNSKPDTPDVGFNARMLFQTVFGEFALVGTSRKAVFPGDVDIVGPKWSKASKDARGKVNIREIASSLKTLSGSVTEGPAMGATLRQMCEPFAEEAREYLTICAACGVYSALAKKMAKLGNKEPHVCFDFSGGLDMIKLSASEAGVVQALNSRLFRTEGAKGVFAAQSSVGEQAVEI